MKSKTSNSRISNNPKFSHLDALAIAMLSPSLMGRVRFDPGTGTGTAPAAAPAASGVTLDQAMARLSALESDIPTMMESTLKKAGLVKEPEPVEPKNKDRITALENQLATEKTQRAAEKRQSALDSSIGSIKDLDATGQTLLRGHIVATYGENIKVEGNDVFVETPQLGKVTLAKVVADVASSEIGQKLIAPPKLPAGDGLKGTSGGTVTTPDTKDPHGLAGKTYAEVRQFAQTNPTAFGAFVTQNPEAWAKVQATAR